MSVSDGFNLWIGKILADLAVFGVIMLAIIIGCSIYIFWPYFAKIWRKK